MRKTLDRYVKVIYILGLAIANKDLSTEQSLVVVNALVSSTSVCSSWDWGCHIPVREPQHLWDKLDMPLGKILATKRNKGVPQSSWDML